MNALSDIEAFILQRTGICFSANRLTSLRSVVDRTLAKEKLASSAELLMRLSSDETVLNTFIDEITVGETYFFREFGQFEFLRDSILPEISAKGILRFWSAGCATGEEPYSLAMLLSTAGLLQNSFILATDISLAKLSRAKEARYTKWSLRNENHHASPFLSSVGNDFVVSNAIRERVSFRALNLVNDTYPSVSNGTVCLDVIFCRNVLIYFNREEASRILRRLISCLVPGGWLFLGSSDPGALPRPLCRRIKTSAGIIWRRADVHDPPPPSPTIPPPDITAPPPIRARASPPVVELPTPPVEPNWIPEIRETWRQSKTHAEELCRAKLVETPKSVPLHFEHALILISQGRLDDAVACLRRVIYLDPRAIDAHFLLGRLLGQLGDARSARRELTRAAALSETIAGEENISSSLEVTAEQLRHAIRQEMDNLS